MAVNCDPPIGAGNDESPLQLTPAPQRTPALRKHVVKPKLPPLTQAAEHPAGDLPPPPKPKPVHHLNRAYKPSRLPEGTVVDIEGSAVVRPLHGKVHALHVGDVLRKGDVVLTSQDGIVEIRHAGKTYTVVCRDDGELSFDPPGAGAGEGSPLQPGTIVERQYEVVTSQEYDYGISTPPSPSPIFEVPDVPPPSPSPAPSPEPPPPPPP
ncbi:MAG TPA: hypothetical protein PLU79_06350, partial [Burkholderiaceae bacterium]|nr:hypothetical protein [Burkholderiaceae bacterium]